MRCDARLGRAYLAGYPLPPKLTSKPPRRLLVTATRLPSVRG